MGMFPAPSVDLTVREPLDWSGKIEEVVPQELVQPEGYVLTCQAHPISRQVVVDFDAR